jgi:membrane-bound metal-dependent hydrolase YbcI (DUF457 family)
MHPATHFLTGWALAQTASLERRDRGLVVLGAVVADLDGLGLAVELATSWVNQPVEWYSDYHRFLTHNVGMALLLALGTPFFARRKFLTPLLVVAASHLHILVDLAGSRGPDGYQWPVPYLLPFSARWQLAWQGQWEFNAWPNVLLTIVLLALSLYWAWRKGVSPLEIFSPSADQALVTALRGRFGNPESS